MTQYNEYPDIEIPAFLQGADWNDQSWHNDAMPHSTLYLTVDESGDAPAVEVWVNYPDVADREYLGNNRYVVEYVHIPYVESSRDKVLYMGDDEQVVRGFVRGAEVAKTIIADILERPMRRTSRGDVRDLRDARTFSDLHDMCDANVLGIQENILEDAENEIAAITGVPAGNDETDLAALAAVHDIIARAQDIVDLWLHWRKR